MCELVNLFIKYFSPRYNIFDGFSNRVAYSIVGLQLIRQKKKDNIMTTDVISRDVKRSRDVLDRNAILYCQGTSQGDFHETS